MKQIIVFSRTSTTTQDVEQQTKELIKEATHLGYSEKNQIIVEYQESGIKLDIHTRQGIRKLKEAIISNPNVDCVICWELTRIARRADVIYNIRDFLLEHKIRWIVCKPYMELIDKNGEVTQVSSLMLGIFSSFAESEMMIKNERFKRARAEMKEHGQKSGGATIFGYLKNEDKRMIPHPQQAPIIVDLFTYYADNQDASYHSTYMYAMSKYPEYFPSLPYKKAQRKISHFFELSVYWEGNWCYPKLISEDLYERVSEKAKHARCVPRYECKGEWLGRGRVYCKHCEKMMVPVGGTTRAYNCPTDKEHNMTINIDAIEWLLWEEAKVVANIKASVDNKEIIIKTNRQIEENQNIIEGYKTSLNEYEVKQSKLVELYIDGKINKDIFDTKNNDIEYEKERLNKKIENLNSYILELQTILNNSQNNINIKSINYDEISNFNAKLDIIKNTINKVWCEKIEPKTYKLEFEYNGVVVPQRGVYIYMAKNQFKKIYRVNEDETEDLIYNEGRVVNGKDGKFIKIDKI